MMEDRSGHFTPEVLGAYRQGRLAPEDREALQDHLALCPECADTLLELGRFQESMEAGEAMSAASVPSAETEASWQALRARLPRRQPPALPSPRRSPSPRSFYALAAALAACVIGFPLWMILRPQAPPILLIQPGAFEITRGEGRTISVALDQATAVLALPVPSRSAFSSYRIEIRTLQGETKLTVTPTPVPGPAGTEPPRLVAFALPQGALPGGEYRLRLVGLREGREEVLAEHRLRVGPP